VAKEILCSFGVDVDAVAGWLGLMAARIRQTIFHAACLPAKSAACAF